MTEPLFFDTDCISAFLWVNNESILSKLFPGRIVIPKEVYDELSHPGVNRVKGLKAQVDLMLRQGMQQSSPLWWVLIHMNFTESLQVIQTPDTKSSVAEKLLPFHLQKRNKAYLPAII